MAVSAFFESAENWPTAVMHEEEDLFGSKQRLNYNVVFYRLLLSCFQESIFDDGLNQGNCPGV